MKKQREDDFDDEDDFIDEDENDSVPNSKDTARPSASEDSSRGFNPAFNFGPEKHDFGGIGLGQARMNPFGDSGMSMGLGGFGGGFDRFGSNLMGLHFSEHDGHARHSSDSHFESDFLRQYNQEAKGQNKYGKKKEEEEEKKQEKKQGEETEKQRLLRLAKKIDLPEEEQITIVDWAIRGPAELIRLVLEYILIPYKERKYVFITKDQWFNVDRIKMLQKHPEIQLPYLEDGDRIVCGTEAMLIYILHKYNRTELLGKTPDEKVRIATAASIYWDLLEDYYQLVYGEYDDKLNWERAKEKYINQKFRLQLNRMVSFFKSKHFPTEQEFTWMDFAIAETVTILNEMDYRFKDQSTYVQNYVAKVFALPQFIVYRQSNRFHERPYNGLGAVYK